MPMSINRKGNTARILMPGEGELFSVLGLNMSFKLTSPQSAGKFTVIEAVEPPGAGPGPRWHKTTTLIIYVLEGTFTIQVDDQEYQAVPGSFIYIPPGIIYNYSNQTNSDIRYLMITSPAGMEEYGPKAYEIYQKEPSWPPQDMKPFLELMAKYDIFEPPVEA